MFTDDTFLPVDKIQLSRNKQRNFFPQSFYVKKKKNRIVLFAKLLKLKIIKYIIY